MLVSTLSYMAPQPRELHLGNLCAQGTNKVVIFSYRILEWENLPTKKLKSMCQMDNIPRLNKFELARHTENSMAMELNMEPEGHAQSSTYNFESLPSPSLLG